LRVVASSGVLVATLGVSVAVFNVWCVGTGVDVGVDVAVDVAAESESALTLEMLRERTKKT